MALEAQNNPFTSVLMVGAADPEALPDADPSAGSYRFVIDDTGAAWIVDSTGSATAVGGASGLTDPMTTRGDVIVRNASNVTSRLAIGSSGKVLSSDGTDISWQTPSSSGALVLREQHTASSSATLDFTSFVSSLYDDYLIVISAILPATNAADFRMTVGTGGGPTYDTGNNYEWAATGRNSGNTATSDNGSTGIARLLKSMTNNSGFGLGNMTLTAHNLRSTTVRKAFHGTYHFCNSVPANEGGDFFTMWSNGSTAVSALRFDFSSGNIASGTIRIYGIANS